MHENLSPSASYRKNVATNWKSIKRAWGKNKKEAKEVDLALKIQSYLNYFLRTQGQSAEIQALLDGLQSNS